MSVAELSEKLNPLSVRFDGDGTAHRLYNVERHVANLRARLTDLAVKQKSFNMIIMGPPGSGKNALFESCVSDFTSGQRHTRNNQKFNEKCVVIRVDGLLCGKAPQLSINAILRQLKVHSELLDDKKGIPFEDRVDQIMNLLRSKLSESGASKGSKVFVFLLDKLEYFCSGNQMILCHLLEASSSQDSCLGVVGITSRADIVELFEKRIKSRFSHRIINLASAQNFGDYFEMASSLMRLDKRGVWNGKIKEIMTRPEIVKTLQMLFDTDKTVGGLTRFLFEVTLICNEVTDIVDGVTNTWTKLSTSSKVQQCLDLAVTDMMLIVAIKAVYPDPFQFDTLWQNISTLAAQYSLLRSDMYHSFQTLKAMELIVPIKERGKQGKKKSENTFYHSNIGIHDLTKALSTYPNLPTSFQEYYSL